MQKNPKPKKYFFTLYHSPMMHDDASLTLIVFDYYYLLFDESIQIN
jgi:hypothetical protein